VEACQARNAIADGAHMPHGFDDVAGAGLALGANHRRAFADPAERFA